MSSSRVNRKGFHPFFLVLIFTVLLHVNAADATTTEEKAMKNSEKVMELGRQFVEEGRTMVHHAVKRFLIILPAIFFKLGIAFTLLVLVTMGVIGNGFIGFLLLVVGLSTVLSRIQAPAAPFFPPIPLSVAAPSTGAHYHHGTPWDRKDTLTTDTKFVQGVNGLVGQHYGGYGHGDLRTTGVIFKKLGQT